jgi:flagellar basal body rod protein FlgF
VYNIKDLILKTNNKNMSTFDNIQMEEFFSDKKNVKAIKEMKDTLLNTANVFEVARRDISKMEDKAESLRNEFN